MYNKQFANSILKITQKNFSARTPFYLKSINKFFDDASKYTDISQDIIKYIKTPDATLKINIPLLRDDGTYTTVVAYRCHHKKHKLPIKGGIMISPKMSLESIEVTAMLKTMQLGLLDIPFGGGKGGIKINQDLYSQKEIERIMRRFTIEMKKYKFIGPQVDVHAPEAGANSWHMDMIRDTYQTLYGLNDINQFAVVTGKTASMGGILESDKSRGGGVYYAMKKLLLSEKFQSCRQKYNLQKGLDDKEVIIHGFGSMGSQVAKYLYDRNVKIIGIQEIDGVVYNRNGINIDNFINHMDKYSTVDGFVDYIEDEDVYNRECDFLVVASPSGTITLENVEEVRCKVLIEAANGAISYKADKLLNEKGVLIIPDIIANAGNLISSYMEWLKNIQHKSISKLKIKWEEKSKRMFLNALQKRLRDNNINCDFSKIKAIDLRGGTTKDYVQSTIENIISEAMLTSWEKAQKENCSLRLAGLSLAMININQALKNTGLM